ncbi:MAG: hypothetical protein ABEJ02_02650 [Candidatus Paceibacteria bacterium]
MVKAAFFLPGPPFVTASYGWADDPDRLACLLHWRLEIMGFSYFRYKRKGTPTFFFDFERGPVTEGVVELTRALVKELGFPKYDKTRVTTIRRLEAQLER